MSESLARDAIKFTMEARNAYRFGTPTSYTFAALSAAESLGKRAREYLESRAVVLAPDERKFWSGFHEDEPLPTQRQSLRDELEEPF